MTKTDMPARLMRKRGFTLMEMVLVIAVGLGVMVGGFALHRQVELNRGIAHTIRISTALAAEMRAIYPGGTSASNPYDVNKLRAASSLPDWVFGELYINAPVLIPGSPTQFTIHFSSLSSGVCSRVASQSNGNPEFGSSLLNSSCSRGTLMMTYRF